MIAARRSDALLPSNGRTAGIFSHALRLCTARNVWTYAAAITFSPLYLISLHYSLPLPPILFILY
jgi:hypothetical protein